MFHYDFPVIRNIGDVLIHIEDNDNFLVTKNEEFGITCIRYSHVGNDTFADVPEERGFIEAIKRECRGLIFDSDTGELLRRPLHKFFNFGERVNDVPDLERSHVVLEKLDGSMIVPFYLPNGDVFWGTKAGDSEVAQHVNSFIKKTDYDYYENKNDQAPLYTEFAEWCLDVGYTPIFEWCSRQDKIVLDYPEDNLVLLHLRETKSGKYVWRDKIKQLTFMFNIPVVNEICLENKHIDEIVSIIREREDIEGVVICFNDGHMIKIKADWYVLLHKTKDAIQSPKDITAIILTNKLDDLLPLLPDDVKDRAIIYQQGVQRKIESFTSKVVTIFQFLLKDCGTKKKFAFEIDSLLPPYKIALFKLWDYAMSPCVPRRQSAYYFICEWLREYMLKNTSSNKSFNDKVQPILQSIEWKG